MVFRVSFVIGRVTVMCVAPSLPNFGTAHWYIVFETPPLSTCELTRPTVNTDPSNMPVNGLYTASILVNGVALKEYDVLADERELIDIGSGPTEYIEVVEGAEFSIKVNVDRHAKFPTPYKAASITFDGQSVSKLLIGRDKNRRSHRRGWTASKDNVSLYSNGVHMRQNFQFKNLITTEEGGNFKLHQELVRDTGVIRLEIHNVFTRPAQPRHQQSYETKSIPEKALKGWPIDVSAGFSQPNQLVTTRKAGCTLTRLALALRASCSNTVPRSLCNCWT